MVDVPALPGLRPRLAALGHRPEAPRLLAGRTIEGGQEAAHAFVAAGAARDHEVAHNQGGRSRAVVLAPISHFGLPAQRPREAVQGNDVGVVGDHEHAVARHRHPAVHAAAGVGDQALGAATLVVPDPTPVTGIQGVALVGAGDVHDAVHHHRRHLQAGGLRQGEGPAGSQARHVAPVDLLEGRVAIATILAVIGGPVHLRGHRPVPVAHLAQQVEALVLAQELHVEGGLVQHQPAERPPLGGLDGRAHRRGLFLGAEGAEEGHQGAQVPLGHGEPGHAGAGQPLANELGQLRVVPGGKPGQDARTELAAIAVSAVAPRAPALVLRAPRVGGLGEGGADRRQGAEQDRGNSHDRRP